MKYTALFFSDLHLGMKSSQADKFLDFLKNNEFDTIYGVGDIIDFWAIKRGSKTWSEDHNLVIQKLLRKHRKGAVVKYIYGNHDDKMSMFEGESFGEISVSEKCVHVTKKGKKLLVIHGHQIDIVMRHAKWLAVFGSYAYDVSIWTNRHLNFVRSLLGLEYWSFSGYLKKTVKNAVAFLHGFKSGMLEIAEKENLDGVICGHVHSCDLKEINGMIYGNCGDWVETCSCIVETVDGDLLLLN